MAKQITVDQLMSKMADPDTPESELARYFEIDEETSTPFAPKFRINPDAVEIAPGPEGAERSAMALNSANWLSRWRRRRRYYDTMSRGYTGPIIVSEGDSWWQYPIFLKDTIDHLMDEFAVYSMGAAGDLLQDMAEKQEHLKGLEETGASILLLSGGGNDLLAGGALANHLEEYDPDFNTGDYLKRSFQELLDSALAQYERILRQVHGTFPHVSVFCHGYDYPVPKGGTWLGRPMATRNINDPALQKAIAAEMMDRFNRALRRLCKTMPHVTYINCRGTVRDDRWHDELHPTDEGYADVAAKFARKIRALGNTRSGPAITVSGPFGSAETLSRMAMPMPAVARTRGRGVSLHLGLNSVDPDHYAGWSGTLLACENDALAMARLAERQGFAPTTLLTEDATREAMLAEIERAATELDEGDMFLFSVSAHGGQIPDFNGDEIDDGPQPKDETLCLYDFQVADDELFKCWSLFRPGVRILMVADTCHSGTMVRVSPLDAFVPGMPDLSVEDPRVRAMPPEVERKTINRNLEAYRAYAESFAGISERVILNPSTSPVTASVLGLSACQDHQQAMDGDAYGAFTGALLRVWDSGRFTGNYATMRDQIDLAINSDRQTPKLFDKLVRDPSFVSQVPFTLFANPAGTVVGSRPGGAGGRVAAASAGETAPAGGDAAMEADPAAWLTADEGDEVDDNPSIDPAAPLQRGGGRGRGSRDAGARGWRDYPAFEAFIGKLGLRWFAPDEFLELGGSNSGRGRCRGKNGYPDRSLWPNIATTAKVLDALRQRLGKPIRISSAYRNGAYNSCIGGASASQHTRFNAIDFKVAGMDPSDVADELRFMRDVEKAFIGGIGRYAGFVHVDTRGYNATWPDAFKNKPLPSTAPLAGGWQAMSADERVALLRDVPLAGRRRGTPKIDPSAFAREVPRSGRDFDPTSDVSEHQQALKAAVSANSVISFVENLTPGQKEDVLMSTLFAQRAADAKHDPIEDREGWYRTYMDLLGAMGWTRESAPFESHQELKSNGSLDEVAIAALRAMASQNQIAIARTAIDALRGLADSDGTIRLFDFETSHTEGGHFQIGTAEASGSVISMALGAFSFTYSDKRKNILFVSWGSGELTFWLAAERLALSTSLYGDVRDIVRERLGESRKTLIAAIDLD